MQPTSPNHALQRTRPSRCGCNPRVPRAGSLSLGRSANAETSTSEIVNPMNLNHAPSAKAELLIRRPVATVFNAFVDPAVTTKFWFNKSSGRLENGKTVHWHWDIYDQPAEVRVKSLEENKRILIEWGQSDNFTIAEWLFTSRPDDTTWVSITNSGFRGDGDESSIKR